VPPAAKHLDLIMHTIDRLQPSGTSALEKPLWKLAEAARRRGIMVLISDLYEDPTTVLESVQRLGHKGNDLLVFHVLDRAEIDFPFEESANYVDMESGESLPVIPERLRERYRELVAEHIGALRSSLGQRRIDYALFDTSQPLDHALFSYLSMRHQLMRNR